MSSKQPKLLCLALCLAMLSLTTACGEALEEQEEQEEQTSTVTLALDQGDMPQPDPFIPRARMNHETLAQATLTPEAKSWRMMAARMGMLR